MPRTIGEVVKQLREQGRKALVAYVTAGDPNIRFSHDIILQLEKAGVDIVELGVPFAYPVGDGPAIQQSVKRALEQDVSLADIFALVTGLRRAGVQLPIVLFSYHYPVFGYGYEALARESVKAGVSAVLVVDMPPEESDEYRAAINSSGLDTIFLATPTTTVDRLPLVAAAASGFCYYVSRAGTTGGNEDLSASLEQELAQVRRFVEIPIFVGFGIRTIEQVRNAGLAADGVIIGSAFVECIENAAAESQATEQIIALAMAFRQALDEPAE